LLECIAEERSLGAMNMTTKPSEPKSLDDVLKLKSTDLQVEHLKFFPDMTGWFSPLLLSKLLLNVIVSKLFGQYADHRLIHAALDKQTPANSRTQTDLQEKTRRTDGEVWIDYVADLGDGFDATYTIAHLLAQPSLQVAGVDEPLPRGGVLIMGGDEVYPTASRRDYNAKLRQPYEMAWPRSTDGDSPPLLALPGNHDWYDGLVVFLAIFCRAKETHIGKWITKQRRSYFSARIAPKWYVWGIDIALVRDMDQPQADYFVDAANNMEDGSNIILCSAEPGWYEAEKQGDSFRTLGYAATIARNAKKNLRVPLVLSGDSHHYARYTGANSEFITSGGGGAFLHGTLELKDRITTDWLTTRDAELKLAAAYPSKQDSKTLLDKHSRFLSLNPEFSWTLGTIYWLFTFVLTQLPRLDVAIIIYLVMLAAFYGYVAYQEKRFNWATLRQSLVHTGAHFLAILALFWASSALRHSFKFEDLHWFFWAVALAIPVIPLGKILGGTIFGEYLRISCKQLDRNHNDAFSAMKLDSHRNFLRIRIRANEVTIFPICVDRVPQRDGWRRNPARSSERPSVFEPTEPLNPRLIEPAIRIDASQALQASEIDPAAKIPPRE
jgi:hypothetical protein